MVVGVESLDGVSVVLGFDSEFVERVSVEFVVLDIELVFFDLHVDHVQGLLGK